MPTSDQTAKRKPLTAPICRWLVVIFGAAYGLALVIYLIGEFGLLGQTRDPLSGVFLIPLGLPWNLGIDELPEAAWPWLAAAAPLVNLVIIAALCRYLGARK